MRDTLTLQPPGGSGPGFRGMTPEPPAEPVVPTAKPMDCGFSPDGRWFVFSMDTGDTVKAGFRTKVQAVTYIHKQGGAI